MKKKFLFVFVMIIRLDAADTMRQQFESQHVPVSAAMRNVLEQIGSDSYSGVVRAVESSQALPTLGLFDAQLLQTFAKQLMQQEYMSHQDLQKLQTIVETMKQDVVALWQQQDRQQKSFIRQVLYALCSDAIIALESLGMKKVDDDLTYLRQALSDTQQSLLQSQIDKKLLVRMLSIIDEILQKHDALFVSAYDVLVLSHVAFTVFLVFVVS